MIYLIIFIGLLMSIIGIIGCFLPAVPGTPINFAALLLLSIFTNFAAPLTIELNIILGILTLIVCIIDYVIPLMGAQKFGASKTGIYLSILGCIVGIIFFPPFGFIIGMILGAFLGEIINGKNWKGASKAGFGVLLGTLAACFIKFFSSLVICVYFLIGSWNAIF